MKETKNSGSSRRLLLITMSQTNFLALIVIYIYMCAFYIC